MEKTSWICTAAFFMLMWASGQAIGAIKTAAPRLVGASAVAVHIVPVRFELKPSDRSESEAPPPPDPVHTAVLRFWGGFLQGSSGVINHIIGIFGHSPIGPIPIQPTSYQENNQAGDLGSVVGWLSTLIFILWIAKSTLAIFASIVRIGKP